MDDDLKKIISDRLEGWELVDFLQITSEEIIEKFEDEIMDNIEDVLDFVGIRMYNNDNTDNGERD